MGGEAKWSVMFFVGMVFWLGLALAMALVRDPDMRRALAEGLGNGKIAPALFGARCFGLALAACATGAFAVAVLVEVLSHARGYAKGGVLTKFILVRGVRGEVRRVLAKCPSRKGVIWFLAVMLAIAIALVFVAAHTALTPKALLPIVALGLLIWGYWFSLGYWWLALTLKDVAINEDAYEQLEKDQEHDLEFLSRYFFRYRDDPDDAEARRAATLNTYPRALFLFVLSVCVLGGSVAVAIFLSNSLSLVVGLAALAAGVAMTVSVLNDKLYYRIWQR